jgi:hypothetical protein
VVARAVLAAIALALVATGAGATAPGVAPKVNVVWAEPGDTTRVFVERIAAPYEGGRETWLMNLDVQLQLSIASAVRIERLHWSFPGTTIPTRTRTFAADDDTVSLVGVGDSMVVQLPESSLLPYPLPSSVQVSFWFRGFRTPITVSRRLAEWTSAVPGGAYLFPFRREDLPPDTYVTDDNTHVPGSGHRASVTQRFAYDYGIHRWDGSKWNKLVEGGSSKRNEDYLVWDVPVRAMADGWVLSCNRNSENNTPPTKGEGGGNNVVVVHAPEEVVLYAHFKKGTVSSAACPRGGVQFRPNAIRVKAGQVLGHAGNSGRSTNPHLHIHVVTSADDDGQGRPLEFRNVRVRNAGIDWKGSPPCTDQKPFATATEAASGPWQLVEPFYGPSLGEITRHGLQDTCFVDLFGGAAASGYRVAWLSGFDAGGKTYLNVSFRKASMPHVTRFGLTATQYQSEIESAVNAGLRPTNVESYLRAGQVRYAFSAAKGPGPTYRAYHGVTAAQHDTFVAQLSAQGMAPVAVSVVAPGGVPSYTALWEKRSVGRWTLRSNVPVSKYQAFAAAEAKVGRKLAYVDAYLRGGVPTFSVITASKATLRLARHGLDGKQLQSEFDAALKRGWRTLGISGYATPAGVHYAALWG